MPPRSPPRMNNNNEYATVFATVMNNTSSSDEQHSPLSSLPSSSPALPLASPSLPKTPNPRLPSSSLLVRAKSKLNGAQNPKESNCRGGGRGGGGLAMDSGFSLIKFKWEGFRIQFQILPKALKVFGYARRFAKLGIANALIGVLRGGEHSSSSLISACIALKAVAVNFRFVLV
ncbi:uncharacterized protein LOC109828285 [Asparagus officinalis]|uniref:uncharacterized protein LOC109822072 n=1 Tax=Asparagus officinalis TaxID=4686 RepID=UPI00098E3024|nr:uncharacterized protein LOC109822072 [Asparagus officinalis]XP_020250902.1 uncharacterized protein LOC109828285 [Asparagus officinalis]